METYGARGIILPLPDTPSGVLEEDGVRFGALIDDLTSNDSASFNDVDTPGAGQLSYATGGKGAKGRQQRGWDLQVLAANAVYPWMPDDAADIDEARRALSDVLWSKEPVRLVIWAEGKKEEDVRVTLRDLDRTLRNGQPGIRYFTASFREARLSSNRRRKLAKSKKGKRLPAKHVIEEGDTLRSLSRDYYGTANFWRDIARANNIKGIGGDADLYRLRGGAISIRVRDGKVTKATLTIPQIVQSKGKVDFGDIDLSIYS